MASLEAYIMQQTAVNGKKKRFKRQYTKLKYYLLTERLTPFGIIGAQLRASVKPVITGECCDST